MTDKFLEYNIDVVMCIDGTKSMEPYIEQIKETARHFYDGFILEMAIAEKAVDKFRIKIIVFRDYLADWEPMKESKFFTFPDEMDEYLELVNGIKAYGGGNDRAENSLEAIALAIKSDWVQIGYKKRHEILLFTDAPALPLGARKYYKNYPENMPEDFAELHEMWEGQEMDRKAKHMIIYAPNVKPWDDIICWTNSLVLPIEEMNQCGGSVETSYRLMCNSI